MMSTLDVICVGSSTFDTIATVSRVPLEDERILASRMSSAGGGPAATTAVALARLGFSVGFCGVVGDDDAGRQVVAGLTHEGVNLDWMHVDSAVSTPQSVVLVSNRSYGRSIVTVEAPVPAWSDVPIGAAEWMHADQTGFAPVMQALEASTAHSKISVDGGNDTVARDLRRVDLYVPTLSALSAQYGALDPADCLRAAADAGADRVVATAGGRGAFVLTPEGDAALVPGFELEVVSTLGAGDVFHGALLGGLIRSLDLGRAVEIANGAAALSCSALDGRSGIPDVDELADFLERHNGRPITSWPFRAE